MGLAVGSLFRPRYSVFVATSYTFDLRMFDEFWFPRLGEPPLNAILLIDSSQLAKVWDDIPAEEEWRARRANSDYLVRGVNLGAWSFHPKTYLFGDQKSGVLVVGSGNLALKGLEDGHEAFSAFDSAREEDIGAIRAWRDWMWQLVRRLDDGILTPRWLDAVARLPWLQGPAEPLAFVTNWDRSMLNQLAERVVPPVDELHAMAPFFDRGATALAELIRTTVPAEVHLYLGADVSVDGEMLVDVLETCARPTHVHFYRPNEFVHAKIIGVVRGEVGWLLAGSANISRAALMGFVSQDAGNAEAGVLIELPSAKLRGLFVPEGLELHAGDLTMLRGLVYQSNPAGNALPILLNSATRLEDGRITLNYVSDVTGSVQLVGAGQISLIVDRTTTLAFGSTKSGLLVHMIDEAGKTLSNRVPVDDPRRLDAWLRTSAPQRLDVPGGLDAAELDTPVGQMLRRLNDAWILELDATPAMSRARNAAQEIEDTEFWQRLAQEELRRDPRIVNYTRNSSLDIVSNENGELFGFMCLMLDRVPRPPLPHLVGIDSDSPDAASSGRRWSFSRRLQVRLFNVLERWCVALADPRLSWLAPNAAIRNYSQLLAALIECWTAAYLPRERLVRLARTLFASFLRGERTLGFLCSLTEDERTETVALIPETDLAAAAILAYAALRFCWHDPAGSREELFGWQTLLDPALSLGVMQLNEPIARAVVGAGRGRISAREVEDFLRWATTHIDDAHWEQRVRRDLELREFRIVDARDASVHNDFGITLKLGGITDPLDDSRLVAIVNLAMRYRRVAGVVLMLPQGRLSATLDGSVYAMLGGVTYISQRPLTRPLLESLLASASGWGVLLVPENGRKPEITQVSIA